MRIVAILGLVLGSAGAGAAAEPLEAAVRGGEFPRTTSVIAMQGDTTVYERYFGGAGAESLHDTRSAMKSVTALAVGIAIAEGKLRSIDAPAFAYLKDLPPFAHDGPLKAAITIGDLLTMSSALDCDDNVAGSPGNEDNMYPRKVWARWAVDLPVKADYARDATGRGPFAYCTAGVFLLGQILQRATGQPVDRYVETRLLMPLGIERMEWSRSPSGEVMTGGQLRLRTRDLAKLGRLVLDGGRWQGKQIVPATWVARGITAQRKPNAAADPKGENDYGYLFWRRDFATSCGRSSGWYMSGNGGNKVVMVKDLDAVVVVTRTSYRSREMHAQSLRLIEQHLLPRLPCRR